MVYRVDLAAGEVVEMNEADEALYWDLAAASGLSDWLDARETDAASTQNASPSPTSARATRSSTGSPSSPVWSTSESLGRRPAWS